MKYLTDVREQTEVCKRVCFFTAIRMHGSKPRKY